MTTIFTIRERRARKAAARQAAAERIIDKLLAYARLHSGRYIVFGSVARGDMRHDSDIDILVDFSSHREGDAYRFAEVLCAAESLPCDILIKVDHSSAFLERIMSHARVLS